MKLPRPKLSNRMKIFLQHALKGLPFWDVCCDHGYVGIKALESSEFSEVYFVDQVPHIMQRLEALVKQLFPMNLGCNYTFFLLSAQDIDLEVSGNLLIAGVGGVTIERILSSLLAKNKLSARRLLLSPNTDEKILVRYMDDEIFKKLYTLTSKVMIQEGKRLRVLYIFDQK